jgi:predicted O-methyltransferase YrrM
MMHADQHPLVKALFRGMAGDAREYGSSMAAHMPTLHLLAGHWSFGEIVELGVGRGWSTVSFLAALAGTPKRLRSFDIEPARHSAVVQASGVPAEVLGQCWDFKVSDSVEAAQKLADQSVSLLFVDTTHTYEKTKQELEAWLPKMHPAGVICGHDYYLYQHEAWASVSGVHTAVDEFAARYKDRFRLQLIPNDFGLFILWPKEELE